MDNTSCALVFWSFSLEVYREPEVAPSCLTLQDDIGVDVNVLLLTLLASRLKGRPLTREEIDGADAWVRCWRDDVVVKLRHIRRQLKTGPYPAPNGQTDSLRNAIKAVELESERIQQEVLARWFDNLPPTEGHAVSSTQPGADRMMLRQVGRRIVRHYWQKACGGERQLAKSELYRCAGIVADAASRATSVSP